MVKIKKAIAVSLVLFTAFFWLGLYLQLNVTTFWFDDILHFWGGAITAAIFLTYIPSQDEFWLKLILGLGFVALISVLWEFHEFILDWWLQKLFLQTSIADTMSDFFFALLGGGLLITAYYSINKR